MDTPLTDGSVDKPAQIACFKFPRRAIFPHMLRTLSDAPARRGIVSRLAISRHQEKHLPLNMGRDVSPSLFIAVNGLDGGSKQLRHLPLGFFQLFPEKGKLIPLQVNILSSV